MQPEKWVYTLEGTHLSLTGQKLTEMPSFRAKKTRDNRLLVDVIKSIDVSVNKLKYVRFNNLLRGTECGRNYEVHYVKPNF